MTEVNSYQFCKRIADDYQLELKEKYKTYQTQFPINKNTGKRKINSSHNAIIVDKSGNEFPYMTSPHSNIRNEEKLIDFDYIYIERVKPIDQLEKEAQITISRKKCRICEGGGWTSEGTRFTYKDIYCEI
jgi:hypothetical protein